MEAEACKAAIEAQLVIPVIVIDDVEHAIPLAEALIEGGLPIIEITLRTPEALKVIETIKRSSLPCTIGAGTVMDANDAAAAKDSGAQFMVTPGLPASLNKALQDWPELIIPGASTMTEMMHLKNCGYALQKFFPAEAAGGATFLKSVASPLQGVKFMPTGGITEDNVSEYLCLPNVSAIGGSWIAPLKDIKAKNWHTIRARAAKLNE